MAPNAHLLQNLCREPETLAEAQIVLRLAQNKTGPGSGHELGPHTTGLPAICAYIASQRLNNGDVSRKNTQIASCLKASDFEKAFHIVQAAIGGSRKLATNKVYESLVRKYSPPIATDRLLNWLRAVERTLLQSDSRVSTEDSSVKCAIFFWVCNAIMSKDITTVQIFAQDSDIPQKSMAKLVEKISGACSSLKARIQDENKTQRSSPTKVTATPRRSPKKTPLRALPSRDSPQKRKLASTATSEQVESDMDMVDMLTPETPTKRRRAEAPPRIAHITPSKRTPAPHPSSSRVTLDASLDVEMATSSTAQHTPISTPRHSRRTKSAQQTVVVDSPMDVDVPKSPLFTDSDESDDAEPPPPRRFRPVYSDHKQWYSRDGRLNRLWKQGEKHKQNLVELYGHPLVQFQSETIDRGRSAAH